MRQKVEDPQLPRQPNPGLPLSPDFLALTNICCLNILGSSFLLFAVEVFSLLWHVSLKGYVIVLHTARKTLPTFFVSQEEGSGVNSTID